MREWNFYKETLPIFTILAADILVHPVPYAQLHYISTRINLPQKFPQIVSVREILQNMTLSYIKQYI